MGVALLKKRLYASAQAAEIRINGSGLSDFFNESLTGLNAGQLFAKAVIHFCRDESGFNGNIWPLAGSLSYLDESLGEDFSPAEKVQSRTDLRNIISSPNCTEAEIISWVSANYGTNG